MRVPSAKALFAAFDGRLWALTEAIERCVISGWGGSAGEPTSLSLRTSGGATGSLEIDTRRGMAFPVWGALHSVVLHSLDREISGSRLQFPIEFRIERGKTTVRIEGRAKRVNLYTCGDTATAVVDAEGVLVRLIGPRAAFDSLSLRKLTEKELAALIRAHRSRYAGMRRGVAQT